MSTPDLQQEIGKLKIDVLTRDRAIARAERKDKTKDGFLATKDRVIADLNAQLAALPQATSTAPVERKVGGRLKQARADLVVAQESLKTANETIEQAKAGWVANQEKLNTAMEALQRLQTENVDLKKRLATPKEGIKPNLADQLSNCNTTLRNARAESMKNTVALRAELKTLKEQLANEQASFEQEKAEDRKELEDLVETLQTQLSESKKPDAGSAEKLGEQQNDYAKQLVNIQDLITTETSRLENEDQSLIVATPGEEDYRKRVVELLKMAVKAKKLIDAQATVIKGQREALFSGSSSREITEDGERSSGFILDEVFTSMVDPITGMLDLIGGARVTEGTILRDLQVYTAELTKAYKVLEFRNAELEKLAIEAPPKIDDNAAKFAVYANRVTESQAKLKQSQEVLRAVQKANADLIKKNTDLEAEIQRLEDEFDSVDAGTHRAATTTDRENKRFEKVQRELIEAKSTIKSIGQDMMIFKTQEAKATDQRITAEEALIAAEETLEEVLSELAQARDQILDLQLQLNACMGSSLGSCKNSCKDSCKDNSWQDEYALYQDDIRCSHRPSSKRPLADDEQESELEPPTKKSKTTIDLTDDQDELNEKETIDLTAEEDEPKEVYAPIAPTTSAPVLLYRTLVAAHKRRQRILAFEIKLLTDTDDADDDAAAILSDYQYKYQSRTKSALSTRAAMLEYLSLQKRTVDINIDVLDNITRLTHNVFETELDVVKLQMREDPSEGYTDEEEEARQEWLEYLVAILTGDATSVPTRPTDTYVAGLKELPEEVQTRFTPYLLNGTKGALVEEEIDQEEIEQGNIYDYDDTSDEDVDMEENQDRNSYSSSRNARESSYRVEVAIPTPKVVREIPTPRITRSQGRR